MKKMIFSFLVTCSILVGCDEQTMVEEALPVMVDVEIKTATNLNVNEIIQLEAYVSKAGEPVNDAQEVKFEVWESGMRDNATTIQGENSDDGTYTATYTFEHDGVYYMFAHTTVGDLHVMPKKQFIVGQPNMDEVLEDTSSNSMDDHQH